MSRKPVIVTGCGRSGTHWLGSIMEVVFGEGAGAFEPPNWEKITDVVVDSRMRNHLPLLDKRGHRIIHLVRDGRDVVRSLHTWWYINGGGKSFQLCCEEWRDAVETMARYPYVRLEDMTKKGDPSAEHTLPRWPDWTPNLTETFWRICSDQMRMMGYDDEK